jgi:UDP-glucose 6-dehydrogenase
MRITMIGSGYVGLVSGACFSDFGHDVICVDKDPAKIDALHAGRMPIYEPGLDLLVASNVAAGVQLCVCRNRGNRRRRHWSDGCGHQVDRPRRHRRPG